GVDQPDQIAQYDAVLVAQPRARQHHRRQRRVGDMDRQAGRDQQGLPGLESGLRLEHGPQADAGRTGGGIGRQGKVAAETGVENLRLESVHVQTWWKRSAMKATSWRAMCPLLAWPKRVSCCWRSITVTAFSSLLKPMLGLATSLATIRSRFLSRSLRVAYSSRFSVFRS